MFKRWKTKSSFYNFAKLFFFFFLKLFEKIFKHSKYIYIMILTMNGWIPIKKDILYQELGNRIEALDDEFSIKDNIEKKYWIFY